MAGAVAAHAIRSRLASYAPPRWQATMAAGLHVQRLAQLRGPLLMMSFNMML